MFDIITHMEILKSKNKSFVNWNLGFFIQALFFILLSGFNLYASELNTLNTQRELLANNESPVEQKILGISFKGTGSHLEVVSRLMRQINSVPIGQALLEKLSTYKLHIEIVDWNDQNRVYNKIDHTRHAVIPKNEKHPNWSFEIIFSPNEPEDRELELYHPGTFDEDYGKVRLVHSFYRQLLKTYLILSLDSLNYSQNYLLDQTWKFKNQLD